MSSCVSANPKQDELVVKTGFELRLRKVDFSKMKGAILVIGSEKEANSIHSYVDRVKQHFVYCSRYSSILDVLKPQRGSSAAIVCYEEPSYNGMQCLYHMFGQRLGLTDYDMFKQVVQKSQKNGEAIVFTKEELMWCPSPSALDAEPVPEATGPQPQPEKEENEFPDSVIRTLENLDRSKCIFCSKSRNELILSIENLPREIKNWVLKKYPDTECVLVKVSDEYGEFIKYKNAFIWGWEKRPASFNQNDADWCGSLWSENLAIERERYREKWEADHAAARAAATAPVSEPAPIPVPKPEEPSIQAQLTALTAAITALTKLVETALTPKA